MKSLHRWLLITLACCLAPSVTTAATKDATAQKADAPASEAEEAPSRPIDIDEAVFLAVQRNLRLAAEKLGPKLAATVVVERNADFDPTLFAELSVGERDQQTATTLEGTKREVTSAKVGLSKRFRPGTLLEVFGGYNRNWNNNPFTIVNPAYREEIGVSLTQPLLRGFGIRYNTASIRLAEKDRKVARTELKEAALETVADAMDTYWELVYAVRVRDLRQRSLDRALNLQRDVQTRLEAEVIGERDPSIAQAEAEVALRQEEVVVADDAISSAEDELKVITDLSTESGMWETRLAPTTEPSSGLPATPSQQALEAAFEMRPDYRRAQLLVGKQDIAIYLARRELLPRVDLDFELSFSGLGDTRHSSRRSLQTADYDDWRVGLSMEFPLGNRAASATHRRAKLRKQAATLDRTALRQIIQREVRDGIRKMQTNRERLRTARASVKAAQERLRAEEIRFQEARTVPLQDVMDAEAALAEAEIRRLRALLDLNQSYVKLQRLTGTLLENSNVKLEDVGGSVTPAGEPTT